MSGLNLPAAVARRWHQKPTLNHAECRAVYITDSVLVKIGRHQVAFHRGECEFQFFWKLWIAILLTLSPSTVRTITEVMSKFHMFEILVTRKKLGRNSFNIFQFSENGVEFSHSVCQFTEIRGSTDQVRTVPGFPWNFRQRVPNFFIGVSLKVHWYLLLICGGATYAIR